MTCSRGLLVAAISLLGGVAHADTGMLPNGAQLEWPRLFIRDANDELVEPPDPETFRQRLNLASCVCSQMGQGSTDLYYELHLSATTNTSPIGELYVGSQCEDDIQRPMQCRKVGDVGDLDALAVSENNFPVKLYDLINATPTDATAPCRQVNNGQAFVWVLSDTDNNADPDFFSPRPIDLDYFTDVDGFDTLPPPALENLDATGSESSIEISWDIPVSNATDFYGFQAFCSDVDGGAAKEGGEPLYSTTADICNIPQTLELAAAPIDSPDGTDVTEAPAAFANLEPGFICGTVENGTATSLTIEGLTNDKPYKVAIVAVDFYGNASGAFFTRTVVPKPIVDLWEDIHDRGGKIEGGFCNAGASTELPGMLVILGGAWLWRRRRSSTKWLARGAGTAVVVLVLAPAIARADDFAPYWEDPSNDEIRGYEDDVVTWHASLKLGPYIPDIDGQIGVNPDTGLGPYEAMYGDYFIEGKRNNAYVWHVLPMLDVDRVVWGLSGQVTVGISAGYMQKSAYGYLDMTSPSDAKRERSTSSKNTFRLLPLALTASYRATQLDDLYGIPLVPYVKGGLSYYIWWMKGPGGDTSFVCADGGAGDDCDKNKAYGGTLGYQGTIGLSIRAERIDASAASSMRQSGLMHAGFFAEWTLAKVDGFGSDTKLSVGDSTWFAGIEFEF